MYMCACGVWCVRVRVRVRVVCGVVCGVCACLYSLRACLCVKLENWSTSQEMASITTSGCELDICAIVSLHTSWPCTCVQEIGGTPAFLL